MMPMQVLVTFFSGARGRRAAWQPAQIYRLSVDQSGRPQTAANGGARGGAGPVGV
eukprot:COSAG06_NODE_2968_length_6017_cov_2.586178_9_plen_54_part_01